MARVVVAQATGMKQASTPHQSTYVAVAAGAFSAALVGALEGLWVLLTSSALRSDGFASALVLFCSVTLLGVVGLVWGLFTRFVLAQAREVAPLRRAAAWVTGGSRVWFAPNPTGAAWVSVATLAVTGFVAAQFLGLYRASSRFHRHEFVAAAGVVLACGSLLLVAFVGSLAFAPLERFFRGPGRRLSPGHVLTALFATVVAVVAAVWLRFSSTLLFLELRRPLLLLLWLLTNGGLLAWLPSRLRSRGPLAALSLCCALGLPFASHGLNRSLLASGTLASQPTLTGLVARGLQRLFDRDRDGYSPHFGGRDCNDHDPGINPGAVDVVGNGVDENCSGGDAHQPRVMSDGAPAAPPEGFAANDERPSFVLLSIDAMRPDHMGLYGYRRPTTPNIDRFARDAAYYANAFCAYPTSYGSLTSLWTGRYVSENATTTLAEQLHRGGYRTAAFYTNSYFSSRFRRFYRGFSEVFEGSTEAVKRDGAQTTDRLRAWLRNAGAYAQRPFFTWMHLVEPHEPYTDYTAPAEFGHGLVDRYDEEIARADEILGPLLLELVQLAQRRRVVVVLFADHGEGFGEHGVYSHGLDLHDEALRVPLVVWTSGVRAGPRAEPVSLLDLHPTLLNLAGLRAAEPVSGASLVSSLFGGPSAALAERALFAENYAFVALRRGRYKLVYDPLVDQLRAFDIVRDPGERNPLALERSELRQLRSELLEWLDASQVPVGHDRHRQLIELGQQRAVFND